MNRKISEMMDNLELSLLGDINIEVIDIEDMNRSDDKMDIKVEDKVQHELKEEDISLTHIKRLAMKHIVGEIDLEKKRAKKRMGKKLIKRVLIPLIAAALLMGLTIVAISSSGTLRDIFGEAFPMIQSEAQDIQKSMTTDGITFTAEGAVIDDKSGLFIVSFVKEDGSAFEEGVQVNDIKIDMTKRGGMGWSTETILVEDGTKLICMIDMSGDRKLYGQRIVLKAKSPGKWRSGEIKSEVNLYEAYKRSTMNESKQTTTGTTKANERQDEKWQYTDSKGLKIPLSKEKLELTLDNVEWNDGILGIAVSYPNVIGEEKLRLEIKLIDTRTGKEMTLDRGNGTWDSSEGISKEYEEFVEIAQEDLQYLKMNISYEYFDSIADNSWEVGFELNKNNNIRTQKTHTRIETKNQKVTIKEVEVSALGVKIEGIKHTRYNEYLEAYLQMKDGSRVDLWATGMNSSFGKIVGHYQVADEEVDEFLVVDKKSEDINKTSETESSGYGDSKVAVSTHPSGDGIGMRIPKFIPIEEVESIVIGGKVIQIK